jgi:hypothetical protein
LLIVVGAIVTAAGAFGWGMEPTEEPHGRPVEAGAH